MAETTKPLSQRDFTQTLKGAFNDVDKSLTTNGFLVGKVGHKVTLAITTTSVTDDTESYSFSDSGIPLYTLTIVYTDGTREQMISAERTA